jgi:hypothetical protein
MKVKESELSPGARAVWDALDIKTRQVIQKDNPFRNERDRAIRELVARGVMYVVLEEITGISDSGLQDIVTKGYGLDFMKQKQLLHELKKSFDLLYECLSLILEGGGNNVRQSKRKKDHR